LILITILTTVENSLDFIFILIVNVIRRRRRGEKAIDHITMPGGEAIDMEDRMLTHRGWKIQSVSEFAGTFQDLVWAELVRRQLSNGVGGCNVF